MRRQTLTRLQKLEALLLSPKERGGPLEVIPYVEDESGNIIKGADKLPGGKNYKPGPKLFIHIVPAGKDPDNEAKK